MTYLLVLLLYIAAVAVPLFAVATAILVWIGAFPWGAVVSTK